MVETLRKKDDIGFTTVTKPLKSFTCNQARKENRSLRDYYINQRANYLLLILCSDQIQRIEALLIFTRFF